MYKIFYQPNTKSVKKNSIIRVDTDDLSKITELTDWEYKILDKFETVHYIMPLEKKVG